MISLITIYLLIIFFGFLKMIKLLAIFFIIKLYARNHICFIILFIALFPLQSFVSVCLQLKCDVLHDLVLFVQF